MKHHFKIKILFLEFSIFLFLQNSRILKNYKFYKSISLSDKTHGKSVREQKNADLDCESCAQREKHGKGKSFLL
jgi:hypothetical protein